MVGHRSGFSDQRKQFREKWTEVDVGLRVFGNHKLDDLFHREMRMNLR